MVTSVILNFENNKLKNVSIKDHSGYKEKNKDIICSAISAIVNGTVNFLKENYNNNCLIEYSSANVKITLKKENYDCEFCLNLMIYQLKNISKFYPRNLKFK